MPTKIGIGPLKKAIQKFSQETSIGQKENLKKKYGLALSDKVFKDFDEAERKTARLLNESMNEEEEEGQLSVDVYQTEKEMIIIAPIAGVTTQDISMSITDDVISIQGKRNFTTAIPEENYYTKECFWGNFSRSIVLPEAVDATKVKATFKNGILKITIPKIEQIRTRIIKIAS